MKAYKDCRFNALQFSSPLAFDVLRANSARTSKNRGKTGDLLEGFSDETKDIRAAFLDGDGAEMHQAARALAASGIVPL